MSMFSSEPGSQVAIKTVAEVLFSEMQAFGQFGAAFGLPDEKIHQYIEERASFVNRILRLAEAALDLRFADASLPYCYNRRLWPDQLPPAGYTGSGEDPLPSQVALTLTLMWNLETTEDGAFLRLLLSALWMAHAHHDLRRAITYLLDLQQSGFVLNSSRLAEVILFLLRARSQSESEAVLLERMFDGNMPDSPAMWMQADLSAEWVEPEVRPGPAATAIIMALLEESLLRIQKVRAAASWDEWTIGQFTIKATLDVVMKVTDRIPDLPLGIEASLAQFEEISADAASLFSLFLDQSRVPDYKLFIVTALPVGIGLGGLSADGGWDTRFYQQRLVIPAAWRDAFRDPERTPKGPGWERLSWRLAEPFQRVLSSQLSGDLMPAFSVAAELESSQDIILRQLSEAADARQDGRIQEALDKALMVLAEYPWNGAAYLVSAISCRELNQLDTALEYAIRAVILTLHESRSWSELDAVLCSLGAMDESGFALAISKYLTPVSAT